MRGPWIEEVATSAPSANDHGTVGQRQRSDAPLQPRSTPLHGLLSDVSTGRLAHVVSSPGAAAEQPGSSSGGAGQG